MTRTSKIRKKWKSSLNVCDTGVTDLISTVNPVRIKSGYIVVDSIYVNHASKSTHISFYSTPRWNRKRDLAIRDKTPSYTADLFCVSITQYVAVLLQVGWLYNLDFYQHQALYSLKIWSSRETDGWGQHHKSREVSFEFPWDTCASKETVSEGNCIMAHRTLSAWIEMFQRKIV